MVSETETAVQEARQTESPPAPGAVSKPVVRQRLKRGQIRVPKQERLILKGNSVRAETWVKALFEEAYVEIVKPTCQSQETPAGEAQIPIPIDTSPHNWDTALGVVTGSQDGKRQRGGVEVLSPFEGNTAEKWDIHGTGRMNLRRSVRTREECLTMALAAILHATVSREKKPNWRALALQRHHFVASRGDKTGKPSILKVTTFDAASSIHAVGRAYKAFLDDFERRTGSFKEQVLPATVQRLTTTGGIPSPTRKPLYQAICQGGEKCKAGVRMTQDEWDALGPRPERIVRFCATHSREHFRVSQVVGEAAIQPPEPLKIAEVNAYVAQAKAKLQADREAELELAGVEA
jgi:hypothetical protein